MASHGVPRFSNDEPKSAQAYEKEQKKIVDYQALVRSAEEEVHSQPGSAEATQLTAKLLMVNPEYYTIWNQRRRIIQHQVSSLGEEAEKEDSVSGILSRDLDFLIPLLLKFPKCYWLWCHRLWLLQQASSLLPVSRARKFWTNELALVNKMLGRDGRNFHGWGYRRTVVAALESRSLNPDSQDPSMVKSELDYTTRMINTNLSNFSAWHNRSKLIPRLMNEEGASDDRKRAMLDEELELILNALYTDPYDQSLWFYHAYLVSAFTFLPLSTDSIAPSLSHEQRLQYLGAEICKIEELLEVAGDSKWIYQSLIELCTTYRSVCNQWPGGVEAQKIRDWLQRLKRQDPLRKGRWEVFEQSLSL